MPREDYRESSSYLAFMVVVALASPLLIVAALINGGEDLPRNALISVTSLIWAVSEIIQIFKPAQSRKSDSAAQTPNSTEPEAQPRDRARTLRRVSVATTIAASVVSLVYVFLLEHSLIKSIVVFAVFASNMIWLISLRRKRKRA